MKLKFRTIGLLGMVAALALAACGGDDDTPTPQSTATRVPATATPADTPTPITIIVAGTPVVVTATPAPTSTPAPTAVMTRKPTGVLRVVANLGNEQWLLRATTGEAPMWNISDPMVWWDWGVDGPTNEATLESWDFTENADGSLDWEWVIKPGIKFAKGWGEVTSEDVAFTMTEMLKEGTVNSNRRQIGRWYGSDPANLDFSDPSVLKIHQPEKFNLVEQFRVISAEEARTLRPISKAYMEAVGEDEFTVNPVLAGPYEFTSQQRGYDVVVTAVPDFHRVTPGFEQIHYFKVLDLATKIAMLRTGQIDIGTLPGRLAAEVENAGVDIIVGKNSVEPFVQFGGLFPDNPNYDPNFPWTTDTPLEGSALEVRKALNYAIDRQAILDKILFGFGEIGIIPFSFLSPTAGAGGGPPEWWNDAWKPHPFDPALARQILKDAGHEGCFEFNMWLISGQVYGPDVGEAVAGMWEEHLGCTINRRLGEYRPTLRAMLLDQATDGWTYLFEGGPIARPQRYACLHGGPTYQVIMHSTLQFFTDICSISDRSLDPVEIANLERQIGDWEYRVHNAAAVVSVHTLFGVGDAVKAGSYIPFPKKQVLGGLEFAQPS
ncbi:MAG: ABC transporter substrate-binding protein [Chloroflexi bacterium]|nr:ABC transporter substrate-binding protein [Chloroflexota bacterium]